MARSYDFAIVRLAPADARQERLNIGVVVFNDGGLDVRLARRLDKVRAITAALDHEVLRDAVNNLALVDEKLRDNGIDNADSRLAALSSTGPISLSLKGTFVADGATAYENRIGSILKAMVDVEPAPLRPRSKRSKLLTQIKFSFRQERVLARKDEDLSSHRIVPRVEIDTGLVADLVLKNGAVHVVEAVDASSESESPRKAIGEIGISALVLERARMKFGDNIKAKLVYSASASLEQIVRPSLDAAEHQNAELINWESADDRSKFVHQLASLATPIERKRKRSVVRAVGPLLDM